MVAHGSTYPSTNITGLEEYDASLLGKLSQFGVRQMYLRGLEMRKRVGNLISPVYKPGEILVKSLSNQANINSAYAFMNGLYAVDPDFAGLENI